MGTHKNVAIPNDHHFRLKMEAVRAGVSIQAYLAKLIDKGLPKRAK